MSSFPREVLRRKVRAIVHQSCWQRFEGDEAGANALWDGELSRLLIDAGPPSPDDATVTAWFEEDREEFDRAMLIGELVARRLSNATLAATPVSAPARVASPTNVSAAARERRADVPAIADLLDDMLEQDRRSRTAV